MSDDGRPVRVGPRSERRVDLTRTQAQIWTSQRLHPDVPLANMADRIHLAGVIDPDRLTRAFDVVVRATDVLRMVIDDGVEPTARILAAPPRSTEVVDVPAADAEAWCRSRIETPIDATACVYDSVLLRHADDDWTWWLDLHHVATDASSSALVVRATALAYEFDDGDPSRLSEVIDGDFFGGITEPDPERAATWKAAIADAEPQPPLTLYGARGVRSTRVERLPVPVDHDAVGEALNDSYRTISQELGRLTISAMAAAQTVARLDGRRTVVVGVPIHHRLSPGARRLVGPLMELYPLVVTLDDETTNRELFRRVHRSIVELLRRAKPGESPEAGFEIVLNVFTVGYGDFAGIPMQVEWTRSRHVDPNHIARFQVYGREETTDVRWELDVNTELSADESWERLGDHVGAVVDGIVARPDATWHDVSLIGERESAELRLLDAANVPEPVTTPVHEQIRRLLAADPDRVVAEDDDEITAREFDRRADDVAAWLASEGAGRGTTVGLRLRRSVDVLIAVHGVLRAGAAFVMLDPDDPVARHDVIAADAGLVTIVDAVPSAFEHADRPRPVPVELDDLAYVLYTSGSTGEPKGVPISHRGLADYLRFAASTYVDHDEPVVALHSALVFDLTITSLFLSFLTGGRTVVFGEGPVEALGRIARDDRITVLKATPSQLELFTRLADRPRPLRSVIVGGEAFRRPVAERVVAACESGVRVFNEYGPTEAVVGCMIHEYDPAVDTGADVPIGRAADGCAIRILDDAGSTTPSGAWGELWVRRDGMPDSYLNRPELSATLFVDLDGDGLRWYRTGDRVRVERPGVATYGGRLDDQVKVGGVRLEPAEVEAALVSHPDVVNSLVRVWSPDVRGAGAGTRCVRCGLGADVPGVTFDGVDVCSVCRSFDEIEPQAQVWFRTEADLDRRLAEVRERHDGDIDCLHLLSGGKDSTYALYQLVERGWRVHALTLDNGFISDGAKENIRRSVADLGITHEFATTDAMNEIFRDSLDRYSNVCQGCYKTIYTLAVARAVELGIPVIVTGLSRGQFFETRLVPHQFEHGRFDPDEIDRTVLEARRVYHHTTDAVTELLPEQAVFDHDDVFERVEFLDFYRYVDIDLAEVYRFLEARAPWVRPADTGRSTNCLINVAGIQVHRQEQGYHNYAEPYSWDVRLGHKTRDEALEELDDVVDDDEVERLLAEVGYRPKANEVLTAWYQTRHGDDLDPDELRTHLRTLLPEHAVPNAFVRIDEVPLAASAKADTAALPAPTRFHRRGGERVEPTTAIESRLCEIWSEVLGLEAVGTTDDFFDLGGASLAALEVVAAIDAEFGTDLHDAAVFRARTIRELATVVFAAAGGSTAPSVPIPALDDAPLSAGEEAMLFEYRADPSSTRYNVTRRYAIDGEVDLERLEQAIRDVAMLHGPLHTSYAADRHPLAVDDAVSFERVPIPDDEAFDRFADVQRTVPFDLDEGPLVRVHTATTGPGRTAVLIGVHHITIDAGTFDVFWAQIADRYAGGALPELPCSYAEHGDWQRSAQPGDSADFWLARSAERRAMRAFGLPNPTPAVPDGYVSRRVDVAPRDLSAAGGTAFAASMAAAATTFSAFVGDDWVEFGITASTKNHPDAAELVGYYLNTLPVGFDIDRSDSFARLVGEAGAAVSEALPHRSYPFASIVRDARAAGHAVPAIGLMLAFEALSTPELDGAEVSHRILASGTAVADLSLIVQERTDSVQIGLEYRGAVIDGAGADAVLDVFEAVLVGGSHAPDSELAALLAPHLGRDLHGTDLPISTGSVLTRIAAAATGEPDLPAVVADDATLSWGELADRVAHLATRLQIGDGTVRRVGVSIERSVDLVVALLAAQFSGAAYVPLDPTSGSTRLERMARAADIDRLVVRPRGDRLGLAADRVVELPTSDSADADGADRPHLAALAASVDPTDPAYVIFTSGSTGQPRGVEVSHANLLASTAARSVWYDRDPERFLVTSSVGFDSSVVGLFWTLATGGTVVMPGDDEVHDVDRLGDVIADRGVTHTLMVPSLHRALVARSAEQLGGLAVSIVAGEACTDAVVAEHVTALPDTALVNEYGPTEATVWATAHRFDGERDRVPIGGPIPGVTVRVADASLRPVPAGVRGELMISGPTVTRGYVADPVATAERFVDINGRRWYRTGDLVRADGGVLEFVGRVDDQLNVGGVRVEPAEVERELVMQPTIDAAIVVAAGSPPRLVAHVETLEPVDEPALRAALAPALPPGSVPRHLVAWPELPRTPHGKLDRAAAATLPFDDHAPAAAGSAGDTMLDLVVEAWTAALGRGDVGPDADFFDVGGDSLAAVEIVTRLGDALDRTVAIGALLAAPTPRQLASTLGGGGLQPDRPGDEYRLVTLRPGTDDGPLVVLTPAWDDVFGYQALAEAFPDDATVLALTYHEQPGRPLVTTVDELVTDSLHLVRSAVDGRSKVAVVGWSVGGVVAVELADRLRAAGDRVDLVAAVDTYFPGEHRHLWSNRWWKYKSMLRPGSLGAAASELRTMAGRRVRRAAGRLGRRLLAWSGTELPPEPRRTSAGGFPVDALDHPLRVVHTPMVFFSATTTNPQRTVRHWERVAEQLTVVPVAGRHRGLDSIMAAERVGVITDDLWSRLTG